MPDLVYRAVAEVTSHFSVNSTSLRYELSDECFERVVNAINDLTRGQARPGGRVAVHESDARAIVTRVLHSMWACKADRGRIFRPRSGSWTSAIIQATRQMYTWSSTATATPKGSEPCLEDRIVDLAAEMLHLAADDGARVAALELSYLLPDEAARWARKAAVGEEESDDEDDEVTGEALFALGECFSKGEGGVPKNPSVAKLCFERCVATYPFCDTEPEDALAALGRDVVSAGTIPEWNSPEWNRAPTNVQPSL